MTLTLANLTLNSNDKVIAKIQAAGLDKIRCNLSGKIIAVMSTESLESAIDYMRFEEPLLSDDAILDKMSIRWLVQCSRPALHLSSLESRNAHTYLVDRHPADMFAMLYGRMLFEYERIDREMNPTEAVKRKLFWLADLQESEFFVNFSSKMRKALDSLIQLDAIHSIRRVFYNDTMRKLAAQVRDAIPTETMLLTFVEEVESHATKSLVKRDVPPVGNQMSLNAALAQAGILPWQIRMKENEAKNRTEALAFAAKVLERKALDKFQQIQAGYADKQVTVLADLSGQIPALLQEKYAAAERAEKAAKAEAKNPKEKKPKKTPLKAASRFGSLDFTL